jgi:outer membrane protein assembly factor BamB
MSKQQEQIPLVAEPDEDTEQRDAVKKGISSKLRRVIGPRFSGYANGRAKLKPHRLMRIIDTGKVKTPSIDDLEQIETIKTPSLENLEPSRLETVKSPDGEDQTPSIAPPEHVHMLVLLAAYPIKQVIRLHNYSRPIFMAAICIPLLMLIAGGVLENIQLQQVRQNMYVVNTQTGAVQTQWPVTSIIDAASTGGENSLLITTTSRHQQQLLALDANGNTQWSTAASPYTYALPNIASPSGTVLVALSRQPAFNPEVYNMGEENYSRPLILSLFNRNTGHVLWQRTVVSSGNQFGAVILGGNREYVYVALVKTGASLKRSQAVVTLLAIRQQTGAIAWQVHGPLAADNVRRDTGKLLLYGPDIFWQVVGKIYALNGTNGHILWDRPIQEDNVATLPQEESEMTMIRGMLIVERSTNYYEIDAASGAERGSIPNPAIDATVQNLISGSGIAASGTTLVIYGNGQIAAYNVLTKQELWSQKQLDALQSVTISHDGKLVYVLLTDSIEGSPPAQAFVALDMTNGAAQWAFQPSNQVMFLPLQQEGYIEYAQHVLLTSVCLTPVQGHCSQPYLYALNAETGATLWKYENDALANVSISADGSSVIFERKSSGWLDLLERLRG